MAAQRLRLPAATKGAVHQPGVMKILFRGIPLTLSRHDVDTLLIGDQHWWWPVCYQIGLLDIGDSCIRAGFQGKNLQITLQEYEELSLAVQEAYLQLDW